MNDCRIIPFETIASAVAELCGKAACDLPPDVLDRLKVMEKQETGELAADFFRQYFENARIAGAERMALCQDTGFAVYFIELGDRVRLDRGTLCEAVAAGTARGYETHFLRKSIVDDPLFDRRNTKNNTPPVIHLELVPGDGLRIVLAPKGGGSENMSAIRMLKPSDGRKGVVDFAVETVRNAGGNPCPPTVVGMGIGGTFEKAAYLAKKALLRKTGEPHPGPALCRTRSGDSREDQRDRRRPAGARRSRDEPCGPHRIFPVPHRQSAGRDQPELPCGAPCGGDFMNTIRITTPLTGEVARGLKAGDRVLLSGVIWTGRDQAHKRLVALLDEGKPLPVELKDQVIYFVGPCPAPPGRPIGSAGPTTSYRMDAYSPRLLEACGLRGMIGKGARTSPVVEAMRRCGAVYFAAHRRRRRPDRPMHQAVRADRLPGSRPRGDLPPRSRGLPARRRNRRKRSDPVQLTAGARGILRGRALLSASRRRPAAGRIPSVFRRESGAGSSCRSSPDACAAPTAAG